MVSTLDYDQRYIFIKFHPIDFDLLLIQILVNSVGVIMLTLVGYLYFIYFYHTLYTVYVLLHQEI